MIFIGETIGKKLGTWMVIKWSEFSVSNLIYLNNKLNIIITSSFENWTMLIFLRLVSLQVCKQSANLQRNTLASQKTRTYAYFQIIGVFRGYSGGA